jgi:hypothetical protein
MQAEIIAEAELHLIRIRKTKADMINAAMSARHGLGFEQRGCAFRLLGFASLRDGLARS